MPTPIDLDKLRYQRIILLADADADRLQIFVPAIMGVGVVISLYTLVRDAWQARRWRLRNSSSISTTSLRTCRPSTILRWKAWTFRAWRKDSKAGSRTSVPT